MYNYEAQRKNLFTEDGLKMMIKIRDDVHKKLRMTGAVSMQSVMSGTTGGTWDMMACMDWLVENGELREVTKGQNVTGQERIFVAITATA